MSFEEGSAQDVRKKVTRSDERSKHRTALPVYWLQRISEGWARQRRRQIIRSAMAGTRKRLTMFRRIRNANIPADTARKVTRRMIHFESQLALNDAITKKAGLLLMWPFVILGGVSILVMPFFVNYMFGLGYGVLAMLGIWCVSIAVLELLGLCLIAPFFLRRGRRGLGSHLAAVCHRSQGRRENRDDPTLRVNAPRYPQEGHFMKRTGPTRVA